MSRFHFGLLRQWSVGIIGASSQIGTDPTQSTPESDGRVQGGQPSTSFTPLVRNRAPPRIVSLRPLATTHLQPIATNILMPNGQNARTATVQQNPQHHQPHNIHVPLIQPPPPRLKRPRASRSRKRPPPVTDSSLPNNDEAEQPMDVSQQSTSAPTAAPPNHDVVPLETQISLAINKAVKRLLPGAVEAAVRKEMAALSIEGDLTRNVLLNPTDLVRDHEQLRERERGQRLATRFDVLDADSLAVAVHQRGQVMMTRIEEEDRRRQKLPTSEAPVEPVRPVIDRRATISNDELIKSVVSNVENTLPDVVMRRVKSLVPSTMTRIASKRSKANGKPNFDEIRLTEPPETWKFHFELGFYPSCGNVVVRALPGGKCDRFFIVRHLKSRKQGFRVVRCKTCKSERDKAAKRGLVGEDRGQVNSWPYDDYGFESNSYRFLHDPTADHNQHCVANKVTMGRHAVEYLFNRALYHYRDRPHGSPFTAFERCYQQCAELIPIMFPTAEEDDWQYAMKVWFTVSPKWHKAFSCTFPKFKWENPDHQYLYSRLGQGSGRLFQEKLICRIDREDNFIMLCSNSAAKAMYNSEVWICDATAVSAMKEFRQLMTIHMRHPSGEYTIGGMAFMGNKSNDQNARFFGCIAEKMVEATGKTDSGKVRRVMADWESAITHGIKRHFPNVKRAYCAFHYGQSINRNVGIHGLMKPYRAHDPIVVKYVNELLGAMLQPQQTMEIFASLMIKARNHPNKTIRTNLAAMARYAKNTYFRKPEHYERLDAFSIEEGDPRTSNLLEGFHNGIYRSRHIAGCSLEVVMNSLIDIDFHANIRRFQLDKGRRPKYRLKKYVDLDESIRVAKANVTVAIQNMQGAELEECLLRHSRHAARLFGGAQHKKLTGLTAKQLKARNDKAAVEYGIENGYYDENGQPSEYLLAIDEYDYGGGEDNVLEHDDDEYVFEEGFEPDTEDEEE